MQQNVEVHVIHLRQSEEDLSMYEMTASTREFYPHRLENNQLVSFNGYER